MHIVLFYQYYHNPDCSATGRHYTLLEHLARQHQVTVVTTDTWYRRRLTRAFPWAPPGVDVRMLKVPYANRMNVRERLFAYGRYALGALREGLRMAKPDVIIGSSTPLTAAWAAAVVARLRRVPWVFEVRDLWPDFPIQMGAVRHPWLQRSLYALERRLYDSATHVVTLSPDMERHVVWCGVAPQSVTTLVNGTDLALADRCTDADTDTLRRQHRLGSARVVLYAGSFGRANDIPTLLETARRLAHRSDLLFVFLGEGYFSPALRAAARHQPNVRVLPPAPRHRVFCWFKLAALSLVSFIDRPVLAANAPAKFFDSLAAGTPVIVTNPGWTKAFVERHRCGWYAPPADPTALTHCVERVLSEPGTLAEAGRRGRQVALETFDRESLSRQFDTILQRAAGSAPAG